MTALSDYQFEILPSSEANDGFVFGIGAEVSIDGNAGFDPGSTGWLTQDSTNSRRGVRGFGRDVPSSNTWSWLSHTDMDEPEQAVEVLERFSAAWRPELLMATPGEMVAIRYHLAGRDRRVFGRPRRFAAPPTNLILNGLVLISHDFDCVDSYTYDDLESSAQVLYSSAASGGGIILPATLPANSLPSLGNGLDQLSVGGNARTYPRVRFTGPWTNPVMDIGDWQLSWTGSILAGQWVEFDLRPWKLTVLDQSGSSRVEGLAKNIPLESMWFAPQSQPQVSLSGIAVGGSASATISWRNAWTSI